MIDDDTGSKALILQKRNLVLKTGETAAVVKIGTAFELMLISILYPR